MDNQKNPNPNPTNSASQTSSNTQEEPKVSVASATPAAQTISQSAFTTKPSGSVMQSFDSKGHGPSSGKVLFILLIMAALGLGTGYGLAVFTSQTGTSLVPKSLNPNAPAKGKTYGASDTSNYKDTAEGTLKDGGIEGEGQFHLERPGGQSQNVYMTSSTVDLSQFKGQKIKVWGQTQAAQKAGWLMDVGKVEVL